LSRLTRHRSIERFHQTLKKHLAHQQPPAATKKQLQGQLDRFVTYYNEIRPHRSIGRRPPHDAFTAQERAHPRGPIIDYAGYRVRHDRVDRSGKLTLRHNGRLHHIGIGRAYASWRVVMLVAGLEIRILALDGTQLHHLTLNPENDYQPAS
jgi:Integrase core domain